MRTDSAIARLALGVVLGESYIVQVGLVTDRVPESAVVIQTGVIFATFVIGLTSLIGSAIYDTGFWAWRLTAREVEFAISSVWDAFSCVRVDGGKFDARPVDCGGLKIFQ